MAKEITFFWCRWERERAKEPETCLLSNCEFSCLSEHWESFPGVCPEGAWGAESETPSLSNPGQIYIIQLSIV